VTVVGSVVVLLVLEVVGASDVEVVVADVEVDGAPSVEDEGGSVGAMGEAVAHAASVTAASAAVTVIEALNSPPPRLPSIVSGNPETCKGD
jgi:hypothetical protein